MLLPLLNDKFLWQLVTSVHQESLKHGFQKICFLLLYTMRETPICDIPCHQVVPCYLPYNLEEASLLCFHDSHMSDPGFVKVLLMLPDLLLLFHIWTGSNLSQELSSSHRAASWIQGHEKPFMHHRQNEQPFFPNASQGYEVVSFSCCSRLSVCPSKSLAPEGDMASFSVALTNKYIYANIFLL